MNVFRQPSFDPAITEQLLNYLQDITRKNAEQAQACITIVALNIALAPDEIRLHLVEQACLELTRLVALYSELRA